MAITRVRKSSVRSSAKYNKAYAGAAGYAWLTGGQANSLLSGSFTAPPDPSSVACMRTAEGQPQIIRHNGSPGASNGSLDGGFSWSTYVPNIGYTSYPGGFNGAFFGGGNYITSSAGYTNDARNGWTFVTGLYNISASFGAGNGGFTSTGVPVFVIPYSYGGAHQIAYKVEAVGSTGISSATWTTAVTVHSVAGNGYQAKVAVTNNKLIYVGYSNTTPSTGTIFVRYADLNSATGVPGTFSTGTLSVTGLMTSLQTVNGTFVLTTADNKIYTSTDGATWTQRTSPYAGGTSALHLSPPVDGKIMCYNVAIQGSYPTLYTSVDGITWTSQETLSLALSSTLVLITGTTGLRSVMVNASGPGNVTYLNGNRLVS